MKNKKGQISVFVILGIFLLFISLLFYLFYSGSGERVLDQQQRQIIESSIDAVAANVFASDCVDDALSYGIVEMGKHGGLAIPTVAQELVTNEGAKEYVSLVVFNNSFYSDYPCLSDQCKYPDVSEYSFGIVALPSENILANNLKNYIANYAKNCINFSDIIGEGLLGDVEIEIGEMNLQDSNVIFGNEKITAVINYPIFVETGGEPAKGVVRFKGEANIPVGNVFGMVRDVLYKETNNLSYNVEKVNTSEYAISGNITRTQVENYNFYDIDLGKLGNLPDVSFIYSFAIKNRPPVFNLIKKNKGKDYDILMIVNESQVFNLSANDPDEDNHSFGFKCENCTYSLNKKNITMKFNISGYNDVIFTANDSFSVDNMNETILVDNLMNTTFSFVYGGKNEPYIVYGRNITINVTSLLSEYKYINYSYNVTFPDGSINVRRSFNKGDERVIDMGSFSQYYYLEKNKWHNITLHEYWDYENYTRYMNKTLSVFVVPCHPNDPCCVVDDLINYNKWKISPSTQKCHLPIEWDNCDEDDYKCNNGVLHLNCSIKYCDGSSPMCKGDVKKEYTTNGTCDRFCNGKNNNVVDKVCDGETPNSFVLEEEVFCFPCQKFETLVYKPNDNKLNLYYSNLLIKDASKFEDMKSPCLTGYKCNDEEGNFSNQVYGTTVCDCN